MPNQWGAFKYDKEQDQLRVEVGTKPLGSKQEMLVYKITSNGFSLDWDTTSVTVPLD